MPVVFMTDPAGGHCALFDEAPGGGAVDDVNAPRNEPLKAPTSHLDKVYFHTALDNLEVAFDEVVSVTHAAGAAVSASGEAEVDAFVKFNSASSDVLLLTHNLGVVPDVLASVGSNALWPGMSVQSASDGRGRYAIVYATTTQVRLYTWLTASSSSLASISLNYRVIVFRPPPAPTGNVLLDFNPSSGKVTMGKGRFDSDRAYLQVVPGGSPLGLFTGRPGDLDNGAPRYYRPDGTSFNPIPSGQRGRLRGSSSWGSSMAYGGSYASPAVIQVQVP